MSKNPLSSILDQNKLTGPNYVDWVRNLRIVLNSEKKAYVLDAPMPEEPNDDAANEIRTAYQSHADDDLQVRCYMLASMSNELQRQNEGVASAYEILTRLQRLYGESVRQQRFSISKELFQSRMTEGSLVQAHGLKMIALMERLASLGVEIVAELQTDLLLQSLPPSFDTFVFNFNMHSMTTSLPELVNMLVQAECTMKKDKPIFLVGSPSSSKAPKAKKGKGKGKMKGSSKSNKMKAKGGVGKKKKDSKSNDTCHFCHKSGHWKRNCKDYLASLKGSGDGGN